MKLEDIYRQLNPIPKTKPTTNTGNTHPVAGKGTHKLMDIVSEIKKKQANLSDK